MPHRVGVRTAFQAEPVQCKIIGLMALVVPTAQAWRPNVPAPNKLPPVTNDRAGPTWRTGP